MGLTRSFALRARISLASRCYSWTCFQNTSRRVLRKNSLSTKSPKPSGEKTGLKQQKPSHFIHIVSLSLREACKKEMSGLQSRKMLLLTVPFHDAWRRRTYWIAGCGGSLIDYESDRKNGDSARGNQPVVAQGLSSEEHNRMNHPYRRFHLPHPRWVHLSLAIIPSRQKSHRQHEVQSHETVESRLNECCPQNFPGAGRERRTSLCRREPPRALD